MLHIVIYVSCYLIHFKVWNIDVNFQFKRNPYLKILRMMKYIGGITRLICLIPVIALFIGGGLSCKSSEFGLSCEPRHNIIAMVSL